MAMNRLDNSTTTRISAFLKTQKEGTTFVYDDFKELGSYSCIRSAIVRLCENNELIRLCQGVYMKPGTDVPDIVHIAKEIARRSKSKVELKEDEYRGNTRIISFYTNGSTRSLTLDDGAVIKYIHIDKL